MVKPKIIAIIPARGGSKRIPYKNIVDFAGQPMIAATIKAALDAQLFDRVLVSTDDPKIAQISKKYGAEVPFLRFKYADDHSPISLVTLFAVTEAEKFYDEHYDYVVQLMANCPLRTSDDIRKSWQHFEKVQADSQISCTTYSWQNPWWACRLDQESHPEYIFPQAIKSRSQDLASLYCPNGAIWITKVSVLKKEKTFYGKKIIFHPLPWLHTIDIDTAEDLEIALALKKIS